MYFQIYVGDRIVFVMGDAKRPGSIRIKKSIDNEVFGDMVILTQNSADCARIFGVVRNDFPRTSSSVFCRAYGNRAASGREEVS